MHTVTVTEAASRLNDLLDEAAGGEEVVITRDGRPVARLAAVLPPDLRACAAMLKPIDWDDLERFRASMPPWPKPSSELIREMRDEEP